MAVTALTFLLLKLRLGLFARRTVALDSIPEVVGAAGFLETARDIAQRFNYLYGETFVVPEVVIPESGGRIRALNDPARKMSKSEAHIRGHAAARRAHDPHATSRRLSRSAV